MNEEQELELKKTIRYIFLSDWAEKANHEEIVDKLIQNDERGKIINSIKFYIEQSDIKDMLWGKEILKIIEGGNKE